MSCGGRVAAFTYCGRGGLLLLRSDNEKIDSSLETSSYLRRSNGDNGLVYATQHHPIRVSFVPVDLDTPLEEQHRGKFDVILHKMTKEILCMSKMLWLQAAGVDNTNRSNRGMKVQYASSLF